MAQHEEEKQLAKHRLSTFMKELRQIQKNIEVRENKEEVARNHQTAGNPANEDDITGGRNLAMAIGDREGVPTTRVQEVVDLWHSQGRSTKPTHSAAAVENKPSENDAP